MSDLLGHLKPVIPFGIRLVSINAMRRHHLLKGYVGLIKNGVKKKHFIYLKCDSKEELDQIKWEIKHGEITGHNRWDRFYYLFQPKKVNCLHHQRECRPRKCK